ncbi:hypothetical protein PM082_002363 [Marasmius tenuissimus]|nr:hypothetical protein PM082_002363 [Marasmius tenuissimus]
MNSFYPTLIRNTPQMLNGRNQERRKAMKWGGGDEEWMGLERKGLWAKGRGQQLARGAFDTPTGRYFTASLHCRCPQRGQVRLFIVVPMPDSPET